MTLVLFVLIFGIVVISHELGHFVVAKMNGIKVVEFSVGMGPTLIGFTRGETKYSLKLLPIGGACMFEGEDGLHTDEDGDSSRSFSNANVWARISTVISGPLFNFILGGIVAMIMVSMIQINLPVVKIMETGPALEAGLQTGDRILALNDEKVYLFEEMMLFNRVNGGKAVDITFERDGQKMTTVLQPAYSAESGSYMFGVYCNAVAQESGIARLKYAWYEIRYCIKNTYKSLLMLVQGEVKSEEISGPVGIAVNVVGKTYDVAKDYGWQTVLVNMLNIVLLLTINLGILNLLPIPALDGCRLIFLFVEVLRGKPIPPEKEGMVHLVGLIFFMIMMVVVLFNDLRNIFG